MAVAAGTGNLVSQEDYVAMELAAAPAVSGAADALRTRFRTASNVGMPIQSQWPSPGSAATVTQSPQPCLRSRLRTDTNFGMPVSPWAMDGVGVTQQQPIKVEPAQPAPAAAQAPSAARSRVCSTLTDDGEAAAFFDASRPRLRTDSAWGMPVFPPPFRAAAPAMPLPAPGSAAAVSAAAATYAAAAAAFGPCGGLPPAPAPPYHMTSPTAPGAAMPLLGSHWPGSHPHPQFAPMPQANWLQPPPAPQYCSAATACGTISAASTKIVSGHGVRQPRPVGSQGYGGARSVKKVSHVAGNVEAAAKPAPAGAVRPRTTLVIRGLPGGLKRSQFISLLDSEGFAGKYNFAYLPIAFDTMTSLKYAFVDMISPEEAQRFWQHFEGFSQWPVPGGPECVCQLEWNDKQQGVADLIERYRNSPVMHESVPEECRPLLMAEGQVAPFPGPTTSIKAPKLGRKLAAGGATP